MKNILIDLDKLDVFARGLWCLPGRLSIKEYNELKRKKKKTPPYFAATSSLNWFGFLESINECIETPNWSDVNRFVKHYCEMYKKEYQTYHNLYNQIEIMGYSPVFKTNSMCFYYLKDNIENESMPNIK